ncbi:MAG: hypothetical protein H0V07_13260 [Propionibacteriales bacterium]|nr:hypothetical protein [Propionibacteriales bacterium]
MTLSAAASRSLLPVLLCVAGLVPAGCASTRDVGPQSRPSASNTTPHGGPARASTDEVLWRVDTGGGFLPPEYSLASQPSMTVYGDGTVIVTAPEPRRLVRGRPIQLLTGQLQDRRLAQLIAEAATSAVFARANPDFGQPAVMDAGTTTIDFRDPRTGRLEQRSVYALGLDDAAGVLTSQQQHLRDEVDRLISWSRALVKASGSYLPSRVEVIELPTFERSPVLGRAWPGPPLDELLRASGREWTCGVVTGSQARRLFTAVSTHPGLDWTDHGKTRRLVTKALLPGEGGCEQG